jgi:glycerol-3-phosphate dehydrogenase subunit C
MRGVVDACADCDTCRFLMDESCLMFPRLYRLWDQERETGRAIPAKALLELADLCTLCGLCPCFNVRSDIVKAKTARVQKAGMPLGVRVLADVQRFAKLGALAPKLVDAACSLRPVSRLMKRILSIHPQRELPRLASPSFFAWAHQKGLHQHPQSDSKVAYFVGCTAGYLFPEVARAAVGVLAHNKVGVHVPAQQCCGMPTLLEGDQATTLARTTFNLDTLLALGKAGYEIVCSCPTCGYLMRNLLKQNACYAQAYQRSIQAGSDEIVVPGAVGTGTGSIRVRKSMYAKILKDDGWFADLDPLARIAMSAQIRDLGEYLARLAVAGGLNTRFGTLAGRMIYYASCHQREQAIGSPYKDLLSKIPGLTLIPVGSAMDCCGMGGSLGYKRQFHDNSLRLGKPLMEKIRSASPEAIVTDCLSCRLQFRHQLPYPVFHPLELLNRAYAAIE